MIEMTLPPHLIGKLTYTLYKILVGFPLSSNQLSHDRNNLEGVLVIHPATCRLGRNVTITGLQ